MTKILIILLLLFFSCSIPEKKLINTKWVNVSVKDMDSPFLFEFDKDFLRISYSDHYENVEWSICGNSVCIDENHTTIDKIHIFNDSLLINTIEGSFKLMLLKELVKEPKEAYREIDLAKGIYHIQNDTLSHSKDIRISYLDFFVDGTALWVYGRNEIELFAQIINWEKFEVKDQKYLRISGVDENFILLTNTKEDYLEGIFLGYDFGLEHKLIREISKSKYSDVMELMNGSWSNFNENDGISFEGIDLFFDSGMGGLYNLYYDFENLEIEAGDFRLSEDLKFLIFNNPIKGELYPVRIEVASKDSLSLYFANLEQKYIFKKNIDF